MSEQQALNANSQQSHLEKQVQNEDNPPPNLALQAMKAPVESNLHEKSLKGPQIKFYSGYSSFNHDLMMRRTADRPHQDAMLIQATPAMLNSPHKQAQDLQQLSPPSGKQQRLIVNTQKTHNSERVDSMMVEGKVECKLEETNNKKRVSQNYSMYRIYASVSLESREIMKKKLTRGMFSIASRKYQPIIDSREIFDDEELENNVLGPDQCRLWRNLMNKYFLRTSKIAKNKKKVNLKSEIKLKSDQAEIAQEETKKKRGPKAKRKLANENQLLIKKQEEELSQISQRIIMVSKQRQLKRSQAIVLKKEEEQRVRIEESFENINNLNQQM